MIDTIERTPHTSSFLSVRADPSGFSPYHFRQYNHFLVCPRLRCHLRFWLRGDCLYHLDNGRRFFNLNRG